MSTVIRSRLSFAIKLITTLACIAAVVYWTQFAPVEVTATSVETTNVVAEVMGTGTLEARVTATIGPKINGRIREVLVDQGHRVKTGDLLVRLDDEELTQQVAIARANLAARRAAIERVSANTQRSAAILTQAERDYERQTKLAVSKAVSRTELDKARESLSIAQAGLAQAEAGTAEAQEELVAAEKSLDYQQTLFANSRISAPFDGLIVARVREPGDVVVPGSSILTLISTDELWINAWVDETEMANLADGQLAKVIFRSEPDRPYKGSVARLGRQADRETREFIVDVTVLELPSNWAVGQRADVYIETDRRDSALVVQRPAIVWEDEYENDSTKLTERRPGVFVIEGGRALWKPVVLGLRSREVIEITDGLTLGEKVIVPIDPDKQLSTGTRVTTL